MAVVTVVAFHTGIPGIHGGFVGVDVFFVISGFLITTILLDELDANGRIDFVHFYSRRMRRIVPNLLLVTAVTLVAGLFILTPALGEVQALSRSALAAVLMVANVYFLVMTGGYFDAPTEFQPLLHTWSLSVEEQFYLVWPGLMFVVWLFALRSGRPRRDLSIVFTLMIAASFFLGWLWTDRFHAWAFYLVPARAWELALGGLIAIRLSRPLRSRPLLGSLAALIGLGMILAAAVFISPNVLFPIPLAAIPALGAGMVIMGNALSPNGPAARVLSAKAVVAVGLASYGWYMWHWPMLSLARVRAMGEPDLLRDVTLALSALVISLLLLKWFENPLRFAGRKRLSDLRVVMVGSAAMLCTLLLAGGIGAWAKYSVLTPMETMMLHAKVDFTQRQGQCVLGIQNDPTTQALGPCLATGNGPRVLLWGDSFAAHWSPALDDWANRNEPRVEVDYLVKTACPPLLGALPEDPVVPGAAYPACRTFNDLVAERIRMAVGIKQAGVFLSGMWLSYPTLIDVNLRNSLRLIQSSGLRAIVMLQSPELLSPSGYPLRGPECIVRRGVQNCSMPLVQHREHVEAINQTLSNIASEFKNVRVFDPAQYLCSDGTCRSMIDGIIVYRDTAHLTSSASRTLAVPLAPDLDWVIGGDEKTDK